MLLNFRSEDGTLVIDVARDGTDWRLLIEGREVPLQAVRDRSGSWQVDTHQGRRRLWVAVRGDQRLVFCDGKVHVLELPDPEHDDDDHCLVAGPSLFAAMPGKVVKVLVKQGDRVTAGQAVIILESMKMETEMTATVDGAVAAVHVADGQLVAQGDPLVEVSGNQEGDPA